MTEFVLQACAQCTVQCTGLGHAESQERNYILVLCGALRTNESQVNGPDRPGAEPILEVYWNSLPYATGRLEPETEPIVQCIGIPYHIADRLRTDIGLVSRQ